MKQQHFDLDCEVLHTHKSYAIRFKDAMRLIEYFPYADPYRVAFLILFHTGMRTKELERLRPGDFGNGYVTYRLGKNQDGNRTVALNSQVIAEVKEYLKIHPNSELKMFPFSASSLRRNALCKYIRSMLRGDFVKKVRTNKPNHRDDYIVSLKSFRHTYQCLLYWSVYKSHPLFKGDAQMAAAWVASEMKHSGTYTITARHYLHSIDYLAPELPSFCYWVFGKLPAWETRRLLGQTLLVQWGFRPTVYSKKLKSRRSEYRRTKSTMIK